MARSAKSVQTKVGYIRPEPAAGPYEVKSPVRLHQRRAKRHRAECGMEQALNITLQVGKVTETIEVSDLTPAIETTSLP